MPALNNPKHERFAQEYVIDCDPTQACIRAGYAANSATRQAGMLMARPEVRARIAELQETAAERPGITAERVLRELARIAFADPRAVYRADGSLKDINELDADTAAAISAIEIEDPTAVGKRRVRKVRHHDKTGALVLLGKHLRLFRDQAADATGSGSTSTSSLADDIAAARKRAP